jgi:phage host-nuclease inhibitor protein Gam
MSKRKKKVPVCTPKSWKEADALVAEYGELSSTIVKNQADCETAVAEVKAIYQATAAPLQTRMDAIFEAIQAYADANRKALTDDGKTKTVTMTAGAFGWRLCPPSVAFRRGMKGEDVVKNIRAIADKLYGQGSTDAARALDMFIRRKEEPNKDAMLNATALAGMVDGVKIITDQELFFLDPTIAELPEPK